jgi:hypothetical protein
MSALASSRTYAVLGANMAVDAALFAGGLPAIMTTLDTVGFPKRYRWIFPPIKLAAAAGLLSVYRYPALARLTAAMLTLYFALAVGSHVRVRDFSASAGAAAALLAVFAAMTAEGPAVSG